MRTNCHGRFLAVLAAGFTVALLVSGANAQVLRGRAQAKGNVAPPAVTTTPATVTAPAVAPAAPGALPAAPAPGERAGQTRREGRENAREARAEARQSGAPGPVARDAARETRQETRQNIQATRAADLGVWFNGRTNNGLVISDIAQNGTFATAGFREGDRIVSLNGQPVTSETQFVQYLTGPNVGTQPVQVAVMRNNAQQTLTLQPTTLTQGIVANDPFYQYGMIIDDRNPNQILVQRVFPRTPAYYAGLRQGDVISTFGGQRITNLNTFSQNLSQANDAVSLGVTRAGQTRDIQLDPSMGSVRTALRPNVNADARLDGNTNLDTRDGAAATAPNLNADAMKVKKNNRR